MQGRLTMQLQGLRVTWRHPEQLKIQSRHETEREREIFSSFQCKGAGERSGKEGVIKKHAEHIAQGDPTCVYKQVSHLCCHFEL